MFLSDLPENLFFFFLIIEPSLKTSLLKYCHLDKCHWHSLAGVSSCIQCSSPYSEVSPVLSYWGTLKFQFHLCFLLLSIAATMGQTGWVQERVIRHSMSIWAHPNLQPLGMGLTSRVPPSVRRQWVEQVRDVRRGGALKQGLLRRSLCTSWVRSGGGGDSGGGETKEEINSDGEWE